MEQYLRASSKRANTEEAYLGDLRLFGEWSQGSNEELIILLLHTGLGERLNCRAGRSSGNTSPGLPGLPLGEVLAGS